MRRTRFIMLMVLGLASCGACTSKPEPTPQPEVGGFSVVRSGDGIDVKVDSSVPLLAVAATVTAEGAVLADGTLGPAAQGRNLFAQKREAAQLRFAISDSRALLIQRQGVLLHIPTSGAPSNVKVSDISVANDQGSAVTLRSFDGAPGAGP